MKQAVAFVCAGVAAWLSQGTLALTDAAVQPGRVALLPLTTAALSLSALAGALALAAVRRSAPLACFAPLTLCLLPWLPAPIAPALLVWSGPLAVLPWTATAACVLVSVWRPRFVTVRRPAVAAGLAAAAAYSLAAWSVAPNLPGGDEPHYLVITQSLIADRDLRIENNHRRGDYHAYFAAELRPDFITRGVDGEIYSIHAPGLPALVAPAFAIGGYRAVMAFLVLVAALGSALAWHVAWIRTGRHDAAWFGWAAVTFAATNVFHAFSVYPDGVGGVIVLTGVWALVKTDAQHPIGPGRWMLHGAALALLPWLHTRFAILAGAIGLVLLFRIRSRPNAIRSSAACLAVPAVSCAAWIAFFVSIYGVADPSTPYGGGELGSTGYIADGLVGLFFDQRFGLFMYVPVLVFAAAGFRALPRRLAFELLLVIVPYLIVVTYFRMWWAGWSAPARFAMPILPLLAVPAAAAWAAITRRGTRATAIGALILTATLTVIVTAVDRGRLAYNVRQEPSLLLRWSSGNADLTTALPAWSVREAALFRDVVVWSFALVAAWAIVRRLDRAVRLSAAPVLAAVATLVFAAAAMAASTIVWRTSGSDGTAPARAQLAMLRRAASEPSVLLVGLMPPRTLARDDAARALRIRPAMLPPPERPMSDLAPLAVLPPMPAGEYRLRLTLRGMGGRLAVAVGRTSPPILEFAPVDAGVLRLPVGTTGLIIRGDEAARASVRSIAIEPQSIVAPDARLTSAAAGRAVRYTGATVFFLDDRSFPEPDGFWVGGARDTAIVVAPDDRAAAGLMLTNAPVENRAIVEAGAWRVELSLAPGEQRPIDVPLDARAGAAVIRVSVSSGFRPSEHDPASKDERYLGVRVAIR